MSQFIALFNTAIIFGTVILLGAIGEILTEGSLNYNEVSNLNKKFGGER